MESEREHAFPHFVFQWMERPSEPVRWVGEGILAPMHDTIIQFLETHAGQAIVGNERKDRQLKIDALSRRLKTLELPFMLSSLPDES